MIEDLKGKKAFVTGVGDDQGYGWAIAKALYEAGATVILGVWPPIYKIFTTSLEKGKFDSSRSLQDGSLLQFASIYPLDAAFDQEADVPETIKTNKRYEGHGGYTISEVAQQVQADHGNIDILIHSVANSPEASLPLTQTTRAGYLSTLSSSSYSLVSLASCFAPFMNEKGSVLSLTYLASEKVIPGYGGGLNAAKAALESDTRYLAFELGRLKGIRVNTISAGPLKSRAASAIGFIEKMIAYAEENAPLQKSLEAEEVASVATFLVSSAASAITGSTLYVDNGYHIMGVGSLC